LNGNLHSAGGDLFTPKRSQICACGVREVKMVQSSAAGGYPCNTADGPNKL